VSAVTSRYQDYKNAGGMALVTDKPSGSCGTASMKFTADGGNVATQATDLYKRLDAGQDELYVRWYAKYQSGAPWHHTGVWFGGYNPPSNWPNPQAGIRPLGNDRVSFAVEPVWGSGGPNPVLDFYNYWMQMHTCSACGGSYWGNALISRTAFTSSDNTWACVEVHAVDEVSLEVAFFATVSRGRAGSSASRRLETEGTEQAPASRIASKPGNERHRSICRPRYDNSAPPAGDCR